MSGESSGTHQSAEEYMVEWEKRYSRFRRRVPGEPILATIARLSYMVNGLIGRDWQSGVAFTLHDKGDDFTAMQDAVAALQEQRAEISRLQQELSACKAERDQWRASAAEFKGLCEEWQARAEAAEAREKQVQAALEPFASAKGHFDGHVRDDDTVSVALRHIRAHHVRAAARALASKEGGE